MPWARKVCKRSKVGTTPTRRRRRRLAIPFGEDSPLAILRGMFCQSPRPRRKTRSTRNTVQSQPQPQINSNEVINLDDSVEAVNIAENVSTRIEEFMQTGGFISSDDEDIESNQTGKKNSCKFLSVDSDEECIEVNTNCDTETPSTSRSFYNLDTQRHNEETINNVADIENRSDIESLTKMRQETEDMLKDVSTLLNQFKKGGPKEEEKKPEEKVEESPKKVIVNSCPICLDSLAERPAAVTFCGHIFCKGCITQVAKVQKKCPTCRKGINMKKIHPIFF